MKRETKADIQAKVKWQSDVRIQGDSLQIWQQSLYSPPCNQFP